jgi:hypothetical protein
MTTTKRFKIHMPYGSATGGFLEKGIKKPSPLASGRLVMV